MISLCSTAAVASLIATISLDTTLVVQALISQPVFGCTIVGAFMGDVGSGFEIGLLMQLLWLNVVPVGASRFPESNPGSMITTALVIEFQQPDAQHLVFAMALLAGFLSSWAGTLLTNYDRDLNGKILVLLQEKVKSGNWRVIDRWVGIAILKSWLLMVVGIFLVLLVGGYLISVLLKMMPAAVNPALWLLKPAVLGIGVALTGQMVLAALKNLWQKRRGADDA